MLSNPVRLLSVIASAMLLVAACAPAATGPAGGQDGQASPGGATGAERTKIVVAVPNQMDTFNPYDHSTGHQYGVWSSIMEPLVRYDFDKGEYVGILAESWKVESDTTWVFKLREGVRFHDGSPFTAADVKHSIERIKTDPDSQQRDNFKVISEVEVVDDHTVKLITNGPTAVLLSTLDYRSMTSKAAYEKAGPENVDRQMPIGTGPYIFKELVPNQHWVLEKNPNYWGSIPADAPDEVIYRHVLESEVRMTMLQNGEAQIIKFPTPEQAERIENGPNTKLVTTPGQRIMFLAMNPQFEPWDNKLLRQAVAHALDRKALVDGVLGGHAELLDGPIGKTQYSYSPDAFKVRYDYDPAKAKELLRQAGYPDGLEVEFQSPVNQYTKDKELVQAMAAQLAQVGIRSRVLTPEWGTLWNNVQEGKVPFYYIGRGSVLDPSDYLRQYFGTGVTKRLGYSNPELDEMLAQERATFDPEKRKQLLGEIYNVILEDAPVVFLWNYDDLYGIAKNVEWQPRPNEFIHPFEIHVKAP